MLSKEAVEAIASGGFSFGKFMDPEQFIIGLLSQFVNTEARSQVLKLVGNLKDEAVRTSMDDGFTQQVSVRSGVVREVTVDCPNPVELAPFRTFADVEQPSSLYVLRLKRQADGVPRAALFEVQDNRWQLAAIDSIKTYLADRVKDVAIIA